MKLLTSTNRGQAAFAVRSANRTTSLVTAAALLAAAGSASAGVVSWLNPVDGNWDEGINWSSGAEPTPIQSVGISVAGMYTVTVRGGETVESLLIDNTAAALHIQNARSMVVSSATAPTAGLTNDGTIVVNSNQGTSYTQLVAGDADTQGIIGGTGEIVLNVSNPNADLADATLILNGNGLHELGHTVRGKGRVSGEFLNQGLIVADRDSQELRIIGVVTQGATGVLRGSNAGLLGIGQNAVVSGGTLETDTGGEIRFGAGTSTIQGNATLEGTSGLSNASVVQVGTGGITNNGTFTVNANTGTSTTFITIIDDATIDGAGNIDLNVGNSNGDLADAHLTTPAGITATNGADHAITGKGIVFGTWTNNGTIEADRDTQELQIRGDLTQAPGGTISASNSGVLGLALGAEISGGMGVTGTGGNIQATQGTSTINDGFMNLGDMGVRSSAVLVIGTGGVTNAGTMTINSNQGTSFTNIRVDESVTIDGNGTIDLNVGDSNGDLADATLSTNTGVTATLAAGQSVTGKGLVSGDWISSGTINADRENQDLRITATLDQSTGGTVRADNGGLAVLFDAAVTGGTLDSDATGQVLFQLSTNSMDGVTNTGNAGIRSGGGADVIAGGFTNNGDFVINSQQGTSFTRLSAVDGSTIDGTGDIILNIGDTNGDLADARVEATGGGTATHAQGHTIRGKGEILGAWMNQGTIAGDRPGQTLRIMGTITQSATGVIRGDDGGVARIQSSTLTGGTTDSTAGGSVQFSNAGNTVESVHNTGDLGLLSGAQVDLLSGGLINDDSLTINSNASTATTFFLAPADAAISGTGTILLGLSETNGDLGDANLGAVDDAVLTLGVNQTLTGRGQLSGNIVVQGTIAPGNPAHSTTIHTISPRVNGTGGLLTMAPTTEYRVEASAEEVNDRIGSTVPVEVAGTLRFTPIDGFMPPRPTRYTIITAPEISGTFDTLIYEGTVPEGGVFRVVYEDNEVIAAVTCKADIAAPIGVLDLSDITLFTQLFLMQSPLIDLAPPMGVYDLADITTFVSEFLAGCGE